MIKPRTEDPCGSADRPSALPGSSAWMQFTDLVRWPVCQGLCDANHRAYKALAQAGKLVDTLCTEAKGHRESNTAALKASGGGAAGAAAVAVDGPRAPAAGPKRTKARSSNGLQAATSQSGVTS